LKAVFLSYDITDSNQSRRIRSLVDAGVRLVVFSMHRRNLAREIEPDFTHHPLFQTRDGHHLSRFAKLFASLFKLAWWRSEFRGMSFIICRNIDMLVLAWISRIFFCPPGTALVYECLDIHSDMLAKSRKGQILRSLERLCLRSVDIVLISSAAHRRMYFDAVQQYAGVYFLMENKVYFDKGASPRPTIAAFRPAPRLRIGLVGAIKCPVSFNLFLALAPQLRELIEIHIYGYFTPLIKNYAEVDKHENMRFFGPYRYPDDLEKIYTSLDLVWVADLWRPGGNSDWALANRLYEAGYFGCPSASVSGRATADFILERGLGYVAEDASPATVEAMLRGLTREGLVATREKILRRDAREFVQTPDDIRGLLEMLSSLRPRAAREVAA
jgi:succinoglycan biosynthesis protein ExoL